MSSGTLVAKETFVCDLTMVAPDAGGKVEGAVVKEEKIGVPPDENSTNKIAVQNGVKEDISNCKEEPSNCEEDPSDCKGEKHFPREESSPVDSILAEAERVLASVVNQVSESVDLNGDLHCSEAFKETGVGTASFSEDTSNESFHLEMSDDDDMEQESDISSEKANGISSPRTPVTAAGIRRRKRSGSQVSPGTPRSLLKKKLVERCSSTSEMKVDKHEESDAVAEDSESTSVRSHEENGSGTSDKDGGRATDKGSKAAAPDNVEDTDKASAGDAGKDGSLSVVKEKKDDVTSGESNSSISGEGSSVAPVKDGRTCTAPHIQCSEAVAKDSGPSDKDNIGSTGEDSSPPSEKVSESNETKKARMETLGELLSHTQVKRVILPEFDHMKNDRKSTGNEDKENVENAPITKRKKFTEEETALLNQEVKRAKLKTLSRMDLERMVAEKVCDEIMIRSDYGKLRQLSDELEKQVEHYKKKASMMQKQVNDLTVVIRRFIMDVKNKRDRHFIPVKITRSVGLQVHMHVVMVPDGQNKFKPAPIGGSKTALPSIQTKPAVATPALTVATIPAAMPPAPTPVAPLAPKPPTPVKVIAPVATPPAVATIATQQAVRPPALSMPTMQLVRNAICSASLVRVNAPVVPVQSRVLAPVPSSTLAITTVTGPKAVIPATIMPKPLTLTATPTVNKVTIPAAAVNTGVKIIDLTDEDEVAKTVRIGAVTNLPLATLPGGIRVVSPQQLGAGPPALLATQPGAVAPQRFTYLVSSSGVPVGAQQVLIGTTSSQVRPITTLTGVAPSGVTIRKASNPLQTILLKGLMPVGQQGSQPRTAILRPVTPSASIQPVVSGARPSGQVGVMGAAVMPAVLPAGASMGAMVRPAPPTAIITRPPLPKGPLTQSLNPAPPTLLTATTATLAPPAAPAGQPSGIRFLTHPAPLPRPPPTVQKMAGWKDLPPKPELKISKVANGIVLSWNMSTPVTNHAEVNSYQLYAYQEGPMPPRPSLWKKVGDVKALPLPMACTLTQFMEGHKYHFAVRAIDVHMRLGPFSEPGSIMLSQGPQ